MLKTLLKIVPVVSILMAAQIQQPVKASEAFCIVKGASNEILYRDDCIFKQSGGNGSFSIESPYGLIAGRAMISVSLTEPRVAQVRGLTTRGINSSWGTATRSTSDPACWVGSDFVICAY